MYKDLLGNENELWACLTGIQFDSIRCLLRVYYISKATIKIRMMLRANSFTKFTGFLFFLAQGYLVGLLVIWLILWSKNEEYFFLDLEQK